MRLALPAIILLALVLRTVSLSNFPAGFTPDEASFAYDAYSILQTGHDQWGHFLPLTLESFGDFKSPLLAYLAIPFVAILGLTKEAVRFPNALIGTLAVYATYLLAKEVLKNSIAKSINILIALTAALLLAISPWHIMMSRGAFEANLTTFFLPLGFYFFLKGLPTGRQGLGKPRYLTFAAVSLGLNLFTYHSAKFVTIGVFLIAVYIYRGRLGILWNKSRKLVTIATALFAFCFFLFVLTFLQGAARKIQDVNILKTSLPAASEQRINAVSSGMPDFLARLIHNKYQVAVRTFTQNYTSYFSPQFLFTEGPREGTYGMIPGRGVLYWFELPFLLFAPLAIFAIKDKKAIFVIIAWILLAPIPASLATGPGYAGNRAVVMLPALQILLAVGVGHLWGILREKISKSSLKKFSLGLFVFCFLFFALFIEDYFIQSPKKTGQAMLSGNLEAIAWLSENISQDQEVIISRKLSEPQIYIAFTQKTNPQEYWQATKNWDYQERKLLYVDQIPEYRLKNFLFKNINWEEDKDANAILVGKPNEFPQNSRSVREFYYPHGSVAVVAISP